jgi:hypothetical protein
MITILSAKLSPLPKNEVHLQWATLAVDLRDAHRDLSPMYRHQKVMLSCENTPSFQTLVFEASPCDKQGRLANLKVPKRFVHPDVVKEILNQISPKEENLALLDAKIKWIRQLKSQCEQDVYTHSGSLSPEEQREQIHASLLRQLSPVTQQLLKNNRHLNWNPDKTAWMPDFLGVIAKFKELVMLCKDKLEP